MSRTFRQITIRKKYREITYKWKDDERSVQSYGANILYVYVCITYLMFMYKIPNF